MPCSNISSNSRMYMTYFLIYGIWPNSSVIFNRLLKVIFRWIRILILFVKHYQHFPSRSPTPLLNHISKISISFRPPPLLSSYNTCTLPYVPSYVFICLGYAFILLHSHSFVCICLGYAFICLPDGQDHVFSRFDALTNNFKG